MDLRLRVFLHFKIMSQSSTRIFDNVKLIRPRLPRPVYCPMLCTCVVFRLSVCMCVCEFEWLTYSVKQ